jgi:hypothetical protein
VLKPQVEQQLLKLLVKPATDKPGDADPKLPESAGADYGVNGDNSNTQFAVLALWVAQRHDLNMRPVLAGAVERFRRRQKADGGFDYSEDVNQATASMTCAGLMALAMGHEMDRQPKIAKDPAVEKGFRYLAQRLGQPPAKVAVAPGFGGGAGGGLGDFVEQSAGQVGPMNCYTAWSLERTAMIYDLKTIGDKDWYAWASKAIVAAQQGDGSFKTIRGDTGGPIGCTSFALLVLKRAHVAPELTALVKQRLDLSAVGELYERPATLTEPSLLPVQENAGANRAARPSVATKDRDTSVVDALKEQLLGKDRQTSATAAQALADLGEAGLAPLKDALRKHPDKEVRLLAARTLETMGAKAKGAVLLLQVAARSDTDDAVRAAAAQALRAIDGK